MSRLRMPVVFVALEEVRTTMMMGRGPETDMMVGVLVELADVTLVAREEVDLPLCNVEEAVMDELEAVTNKLAAVTDKIEAVWDDAAVFDELETVLLMLEVRVLDAALFEGEEAVVPEGELEPD